MSLVVGGVTQSAMMDGGRVSGVGGAARVCRRDVSRPSQSFELMLDYFTRGVGYLPRCGREGELG